MTRGSDAKATSQPNTGAVSFGTPLGSPQDSASVPTAGTDSAAAPGPGAPFPPPPRACRRDALV